MRVTEAQIHKGQVNVNWISTKFLRLQSDFSPARPLSLSLSFRFHTWHESDKHYVVWILPFSMLCMFVCNKLSLFNHRFMAVHSTISLESLFVVAVVLEEACLRLYRIREGSQAAKATTAAYMYHLTRESNNITTTTTATTIINNNNESNGIFSHVPYYHGLVHGWV